MNTRAIQSLMVPIFCFTFWGCSQHSSLSEINGMVEHCPHCPVIIKEVHVSGFTPKDSTQTNMRGAFRLRVRLASPQFFLVEFHGAREPIMLLMEPGEQIFLEVGGETRGRNYNVTGSKGSLLLQDINSRMNLVHTTIDSLAKVFRGNAGHEKFDSIKASIDGKYDELIAAHRKHSTLFVQEHRHSLAAIVALSQQYSQAERVFTERNDFALFQMVDSTLHSLYPSNKLVQTFHANVTKMASQLALYDRQQEMMSMGEKISVSELPMLGGRREKFDRLLGRYTLIDFWATWCPGCRANNSILRSIFKQFGPKGFAIVQFSLDDSAEMLRDAVGRDSLVWHHASDFMQWESPFLNEFKINSIPSNYLIDRKGIIVDRNLTPDRLPGVLSKLLP